MDLTQINQYLNSLSPEDRAALNREIAELFDDVAPVPEPEPEQPAQEILTSQKKYQLDMRGSTPAALTLKLQKRLAKLQAPMYLRSVAKTTVINKTFTGYLAGAKPLNRYEKYARKMTTANDVKDYVDGLISRLFSYTFLQTLDKQQTVDMGHINLEVHIQKTVTDKPKIIKVAEYEAENCVINIMRHFTDVEKIYTKFPQYRPVDGQKVYLNHEQLEEIARTGQKCIVTYTELGARENLKWHTFGDAKKTKIHVKVANNHATIIPQKFKLTQIHYIPRTDRAPDTTDVVDYDFYPLPPNANPNDCPPELKFYTKIIGEELHIFKSFKPSSVTGNPADDQDLDLAYTFDINQHLYQIFKKSYNLQPIADLTLRTIVKASETFIGRKVIKQVDWKKDNLIEVDQNKQYCAGNTNAFYKGYPNNDLVPVKLEHSTTPAFVVVSQINIPETYDHIFTHLMGNKKVYQYPVYQYLQTLGFEFNVDYVLDASFQDIDVIQFANKFNIHEQDKKLFRNQLIGRTIAGGVKETKPIKSRYANDAELNQIILEAQSLGYEYGVDDGTVHVRVANQTKGLFNFHSYVLGYAAISMFQKWIEVEQHGEVVAFNVDALVIRNFSGLQISTEQPGGWKFAPPKYYYENIIQQLEPEPLPAPQLPPVTVPARTLPRKNTVYNAAAGVGKSHPWINDPAHNQIVGTSTRDLRDEFIQDKPYRKGFKNTHCTAKLYQFGVDDKKFEGLRAMNKIPQPHTFTIIDEGTMYSRADWDIILRRATRDQTILVVLLDFEQICNDITTGPRDPTKQYSVDLKFFQERGFDIQSIPRTPTAPARQDFAYGTLLDTLRGHTHEQQRAIVTDPENGWTQLTPDQINVSVCRNVLVGDHQTASRYNTQARNHILQEFLAGNLLEFPVKTIEKHPKKLMIKPADFNKVWWTRTKMADVPPKDKKFEPRFAVTSDSFQGQTLNDFVAVDTNSLTRKGTLYTAMTRTRDQLETFVV